MSPLASTAVDLARIQFATTSLYHFLFVPLTLGLGPLVAIMQTLWYRSGDEAWLRLTRFFGTLLLINFAIGVATGLVQEFEFGMNWSVYSKFVGNVFGAPLAIEGLAAFMLESTFLGLWIFGWNRLSPRLHLATLWIAVVGSWLSGYFILVANSWMQHPVGYKIVDGEAQLTSVWALLSNGFALRAYVHTMLAGLIFGSIVMLGVCCWHFLRGHDVDLFRKAAKLALIVAVPVTLLQLVVGNRFGEAVTSAQGMKIAASEAQWNTCQPCGFSLFQFGGFSKDDETPAFAITVPRLLSYMATGSFDGQVQGLNQLQAQEQSKYGSGNYMPNVRVVYWSMRVMAFTGVLMFMVAALGAWLYWKKKLERARWFHRIAIVSIAFPYIAASAGWMLTEMGRQPWIVQGLLKTSEANSPSVSTAWIAISLAFFIALYLVLGVVDFVLMRRYARPDRPPDPRRAAPTGGDLLMDLQIVWFVLIAVLWSGYFLLEGFDFGVGMLLPFTPRNESERGAMFESIGPVWDGNEVWLVVAAGATFAAFPAWYATMFSGFYLAFLLILFFLIVRVVSFEWREKGDGEGWRRVWLWANAIGSAGHRPHLGNRARESHPRAADRLERRLRRRPGRPLHALHRVRGADVRRRLRVPRRQLPHAPHDRRPLRARPARGAAARSARGGRRGSIPRLDRRRRGRSERQGRLPGRDPCGRRDRGARAGRGARLCRQERPRVLDDGAWHRRVRCDAVHRPLSAGHGLEHRLREQPRRSGGRVPALHAGRDDASWR